MKYNKLFFTIFLGCFLSIFMLTESSAQTFTGDNTLATDADIIAFGANYTDITGNLTIDESTPGSITDLTPLSTLTLVVGNLNLRNNSALANLDGLSSLTSIGGRLSLENNASLTDLDGLNNLISVNGINIYGSVLTNLDGLSGIESLVGQLSIGDSPSLTNLEGLSNITSVGEGIVIGEFNNSLTDLDGLRNITSLEGILYIAYNPIITNLDGLSGITNTSLGELIYIIENESLTNLDGLSGINSVEGDLYIKNNSSLKNLDGLRNINSVGDEVQVYMNPLITHLDGLSGLTFVGGAFFVEDNDALTEFCGLFPLLNADGLGDESYYVLGNAFNPTQQQIIDDCGQLTPEDMIAELTTSVDESGIHKRTKNSLTASLENALKSLGNGNTGAAINKLEAFINKVEAQRGKKIGETASVQWIADTQEIIDAIKASLAKNGNGEELTFNEVKPETYSLNQNYPNPFNPTTSVSYSIPSDGYVTLSIYDALGKEVAVLDNGFRTAGNYSYTFDASELSSGMYFYTIRSGNFVETKKMLLMK